MNFVPERAREACESCRKSHKKVTYPPFGQLRVRTQCYLSAHTMTIPLAASDARSGTHHVVCLFLSTQLSPSKVIILHWCPKDLPLTRGLDSKPLMGRLLRRTFRINFLHKSTTGPLQHLRETRRGSTL